MIRVKRGFGIVAIFLVVLGILHSQAAAQLVRKKVPQSSAAEANTVAPQTNSMTVWQARRAVVMGLKTAIIQFKGTNISNIRVTENFVEFNIDEATIFGKFGACWSTGKTQIDLRTLGTFTTEPSKSRGGSTISYLYMDGKDLSSTVLNMKGFGGICGKHLNILGIFAFDTAEKAHTFVEGMNRLSYIARVGGEAQQDLEWKVLQQKIAAWRVLSPKPPLPEEVRQQRVLAESAFREKNLDSAIEHYENGLDIDPVWPEGHFNAALLYAELNKYSDAIWHMRAYVELVPDSSDSQAARDQILIWQDKMKQ